MTSSSYYHKDLASYLGLLYSPSPPSHQPSHVFTTPPRYGNTTFTPSSSLYHSYQRRHSLPSPSIPPPPSSSSSSHHHRSHHTTIPSSPSLSSSHHHRSHHTTIPSSPALTRRRHTPSVWGGSYYYPPGAPPTTSCSPTPPRIFSSNPSSSSHRPPVIASSSHHRERRSSSSRDLTQILPHLYLAAGHSVTAESVRMIGATCVINATVELPTLDVSGVESVVVPVTDRPDSHLDTYFTLVTEKVRAHRQRGGRVVVHCVAGRSRSSALVIAYLMRWEGMRLAEAHQHVKTRRPIIQPNPGFWSQLVEYEASLYGANTVRMVPHPRAGLIPDVYERQYSGLIW